MRGSPEGAIHNLSIHLPPFTWQSALDIALVAIVIYQLLTLVRGTRAAHMLVGAAGVAVLWLLIRREQLPVLNWAINTLLPYAAFAMIVVFAAEIRQVLSRFGRLLTFNSGFSSSSEIYDDLVMAAGLFAQNHTGALIVLEREIGLRTFIESGVPLDAQLSFDLLATIFRPNTPLHDGAVIVQGDRIAAAACFLPLSMDPVLSTQLGTRHRAAIGITEETDALAITVSEETGQISLAFAGKIERDLSAEQLRARLNTIVRHVDSSTIAPSFIQESNPKDTLGDSEVRG